MFRATTHTREVANRVMFLITSSENGVLQFFKDFINAFTIYNETVTAPRNMKAAIKAIIIFFMLIVISLVLALTVPGFRYNLNIDLFSLLLVAVIYILITVFKYGAGLQQESDETL